MSSPLNIWAEKEQKYVPLPCLRGENGKDGYTPIKGKDYLTDDDIQKILSKAVIVKGNGTDSIKHNNNTAVSDGDNSISLGENSKSYNENGITLGRDNTNYSHCGIILGYRNITGREEYKDNQWGGDLSRGAIAIGWDNQSIHAYCCLLGHHHISSRNDQTIFGGYCAYNPDALVIVGNGYEDVSGNIIRSNLFEVTNSSVIHNGVALPAEEEGECELWIAEPEKTTVKSQYHRVGNMVNTTYYASCDSTILGYTLVGLPFAIRTKLQKLLICGQGFLILDNSTCYPLFAKGINSDTMVSLWIMIDNKLNRVTQQLLIELSGSTDYTADIELNIQYLT